LSLSKENVNQMSDKHPNQSSLRAGFFPYAITEFQKELFLRCHPFPDEVFKEPFYQNGAKNWLEQQEKPESILLNITREGAQIQSLPCIKPSCIIFHMARCGSVLFSQFFALTNRYRVVSEPQLLNSLFLGNYTTEQILTVSKGIVHLFGQQHRQQITPLVLKTTSLNIFELEIFRTLFPDVPFIFIYRHPAEIMSSLLKKPYGMIFRKLNPPKAICGYLQKERQEIIKMSMEKYLALTLSKQLKLMIDVKNKAKPSMDLNHFISYDSIMTEGIDLLTQNFQFSKNEIKNVQEISKYDVKAKGKKKFIADGIKKRTELSSQAYSYLEDYGTDILWKQLNDL
jgi:hypothetical protein